MDRPAPKDLVDATGISPAYASMILNESADKDKRRTPSRPLAIFIFRKLGWRHPSITDLTDEQMDMLEQVEPWQRPQDRAA